MRDWVLRWLAKWGLLNSKIELTGEKNSLGVSPSLEIAGGSGNVQVGSAAAQVVVNQITYNVQTMHTTNHKPVAGQDSVFGVEPEQSSRPRTVVVTNEQRMVLKLMKRTGCELLVLNWMEKEMGTRRVVELQPRQLFRTQRYCETIIERAEIKRQVEMGR